MRWSPAVSASAYVLVVSAPSLVLIVAGVWARAGASPPSIEASAVMLFALLQVGAIAVVVLRRQEALFDPKV